jgi:hypothetical protein
MTIPLRPLRALLLSLLTTLSACGDLGSSEASLWVLHELSGVANIEVLIDGTFMADVAPGEHSHALNLDAGEHTLTLRSSGSVTPLLTQSLSSLPERASLIVVQGSAEEPSLLEVSRELPEVAEGEHALEIVDLSGAGGAFDVRLSGQDEERFDDCDAETNNGFTCTLTSLPFTGGDQLSSFITVKAGSDLTLSTSHPYTITLDLLEGEVTTIVVRDPDVSGEVLVPFSASF